MSLTTFSNLHKSQEQNSYLRCHCSDYRLWHLVVYRNQLIVFMGLAAAVGTFGIGESAFLSSFIFFALGIANYAMAAFFAFKYFTYGRGVRKSHNSHGPRSKRSDKR